MSDLTKLSWKELEEMRELIVKEQNKRCDASIPNFYHLNQGKDVRVFKQ